MLSNKYRAKLARSRPSPFSPRMKIPNGMAFTEFFQAATRRAQVSSGATPYNYQRQSPRSTDKLMVPDRRAWKPPGVAVPSLDLGLEPTTFGHRSLMHFADHPENRHKTQRGRTVFRRAEWPVLLRRFCCLPRFNGVRRHFLPPQFFFLASKQLEHPATSRVSMIHRAEAVSTPTL